MKQEIIFRDEYFEIKYFGDVEIGGFFKTIASLLKNPSFEMKSKYLADYSGLTGIERLFLSYDEIQTYAELQKKISDKAPRISLAMTGLQGTDAKTLADLWTALCKYYGVEIEVKHFTSNEEASEWLISR